MNSKTLEFRFQYILGFGKETLLGIFRWKRGEKEKFLVAETFCFSEF